MHELSTSQPNGLNQCAWNSTFLMLQPKAWFSSVRLIHSHSSLHISLIAQVWTLIFCHTKIISQIYVWSSVRIKKKHFVFNRMRLFYFKEKPTTPLCHGSENMKKQMFQWKNLFVRRFLLKWKLLEHLYHENNRKWGKHIQDDERLAEELQKYPCLYDKGNKGYKERETGRKMLGEQLLVFNSIFMNNKGPSHALKGRTFFSLLLLKRSLYNMILHHWHISPAINYGKLLLLFFF